MGFWDTPTQSTKTKENFWSSPMPKKPMPRPKVQGLLEQARIAQEEAKKASSFGGLLKNTLTGLPKGAVKVASAVTKAVVKPAVNALLVRPAVRTGQVVGTPIAKALGATPEGIARAQSTPTQVNTGLLGKYNVKPATSLKQVTGEGLEAGSYLYTPAKAAQSAMPLLKGVSVPARQAISNIVRGGVGGYAADVGFGLQDENKTTKQALKPGLGTVLGAGVPAVVAGTQAVKEARKLHQSMTPAQRQAGFAKFLPDDKPFFINEYDAKGNPTFVPAEKAKKIEISPAIETFVSKGKTSGWRISEGKTGTLIAEGKTQKEAIEKASEILEKNKDNIETAITKATERGGVSPRYAKTSVPKKEGILGEASRIKPSLVESKPPLLRQIPKEKQLSSLAQDTKILASSQVNVDNLNISKKGKELVEKTVEEVKPTIEKFVGAKLSNKEAVDLADNSARIMRSVVDRQATLDWEAAMLKARQKLSASAESGVVDKDFIEALLAVKTHGTDIARKLQSLSIGADPKNITAKQAILEAVLKATDDADKVLNASKGVDFNDLKQATDFYRKFIAPTTDEWLDLIRYNSMLSSPKTHFVNAISNFINTTFVAPIEKTVTGGLDFMAYPFTGKRTVFAGEGASYLKNYFTNVGEAANRFGEVMKGQRTYTNLDTKHIPIATKGLKGKIVSTLSVPMRLLEASDQFFTALAEGGERGALAYRASKGVKVSFPEVQAVENTAYRLFRQELGNQKQGYVLDAIDHFTSMLQNARNSKNPIVKIVSKFTVPFLRTPMNIFKQGIEYSPAGLSTLVGAKNKTEQLSKAIIGSSVFLGASTMLASNRLTWSEPVGEKEKNAFRAAGKQPYSIKVGDNWVSYQKLPPALAFPFAMVASIDDLVKNKKMTDDTADLILTGIAKYGSFLADQSYARSIGDLLTAVKGGESGISRVISNYPQQLIPFKGLSGWINRFFDDVQRKVNPDASFIDKQVQQIMISIPGLSQKVPARVDYKGDPIKYLNPLLNAVSPFNVTTENPKETKIYEGILEDKRINKEEQAKRADFKTTTYDKVQELLKNGKMDEADKTVQALSPEEQELYKSVRTAERSKNTESLHELLKRDPAEAVRFVRSQNEREKARLVERLNDKDSFTDEERQLYVSGKELQ